MLICQQFMLGMHFKKSTYPVSPLDDHEHCTMCGAKLSRRSGGIHQSCIMSGRNT